MSRKDGQICYEVSEDEKQTKNLVPTEQVMEQYTPAYLLIRHPIIGYIDDLE